MDRAVSSHPNRSTWRSTLAEPSPEAIQQARHFADLSPDAAAELAEMSSGSRWLDCEDGTRRIDCRSWTLFLLHTGQHPHLTLIPRDDDHEPRTV